MYLPTAIEFRNALTALSFLTCLTLLPGPGHSAEIYKYQNEQGQWVFTDKKPADGQAETVEVETQHQDGADAPEFKYVVVDGEYQVQVENPYYAPLEVNLIMGNQHGQVRDVIAPRETAIIHRSNQPLPGSDYQWTWGDPATSPTEQLYRIPIGRSGEYQITQSFRGTFSHSQQTSLYAVDIRMPVGTDIVAARAGTVFIARDHYQFGGKNEYFLDKANLIKVLHEDGTYATYAHILVGSASVRNGDRVSAGQKIARSGSTGFSTTPHLHFVIRRNSGLRTNSIPFRFVDQDGQAFTPRQGEQLTIR
ncbi:MAG: peptidoglycan DD-metalloendopeptidase family protein [Wenzhouxiangellaceae bacterium]